MLPATTNPPGPPPITHHLSNDYTHRPALAQRQHNTQRNHTTAQPSQTHPIRNPYNNHHHHTWQQLTDWLTMARKTKPPETNPSTQTPTPDKPAPVIQQQLLQPTVINEAWGDAVHTTKQSHIFRVLSKNVNTLSAADDFANWQGAAQACADYKVTVACFQETNLQWSPPLIQRVHKIFRSLPENQAKLATSNSTEVTLSNYQPGGTCTVVIRSWTSHARKTAQDHHGMGRWSSIEFEGRNARRIVIVTSYRSCNQQARLGSSTFHNQQYRILLSKRIARPNPHEQFLDNLITQVGQWHQSQKAVLLCLDANEDVTSTTHMQGLTCILAETDLVDLHQLRHPNTPHPPTYNCGTQTIDVCLGSPKFASSLVTASILPFSIPVLFTGDHQTLLLDFNSHILFGNAPPPAKFTYLRGVHS